MNPTIEQLALIAANLPNATHQPDAAAESALKLWDACSNTLQKREQRQKLREESEEQFAPIKEAIGERESLPLDEFLRVVWPKGGTKTADRKKWFRDFLTAHVSGTAELEGLERPTAEDAEARAAEILQQFREDGIQSGLALHLCGTVRRYDEARRKQTSSERAAKAARAKAAKSK